MSMFTNSMSAIEHGATWLVGHAANATISLADLTAKSPLVMDAIAIGAEAAMTHGVAAPETEKNGDLLLNAAMELSRIMMHTAGTLPQPEPESDPAPEPAPEPMTKKEAKAAAKEEAAQAEAAGAPEAEEKPAAGNA